MKTSLGIWAFGPMITRFVPGRLSAGARLRRRAGRREGAPRRRRPRRADRRLRVPLSQRALARNLHEVRAALGPTTTSTASPAGCTSIRGSAAAAWSTPIRRSAPRRAGSSATQPSSPASLGAQLIIWPGGEGYNYPFQTPYVDSWRWLIEGMGEAASVCREHGVKLFLEHKNSEPAMKILMRNIGMCLFVANKLHEQGLDNVQINMDWQHLIMNGEHLPEYAALLASEGLLGHLHANSGWGITDDDNMVGATAFMETLELALELRRCGYGSAGERLGFDLYPYTEDQVGRGRGGRSCSWRFIDSVAARIDERRAARGAAAPRTRCAPTRSSTRRWGRESLVVREDLVQPPSLPLRSFFDSLPRHADGDEAVGEHVRVAVTIVFERDLSHVELPSCRARRSRARRRTPRRRRTRGAAGP